MPEKPHHQSNPAFNSEAVFDHEKPQVYQLELEFIKWVTVLLKEIKARILPFLREACDQLDRGGRLDALAAKDACSAERIINGKALLVRIVSMLTKLVARFDSGDYGKNYRTREEPWGLGDSHETARLDDDEDEDEDDELRR